MKDELQKYLHEAFGSRLPHARNDINLYCSVGGQVHIRFELGGELLNGTKERVAQASQRATTLFEETFPEPENVMWVLIYEFVESSFGEDSDFLYEQFQPESFAEFYNRIETISNGTADVDELGNETKNELEARIIIGKVKVKDIKCQPIMEAIANSEMGFKPAVDGRIYFIDPQTDRIFHMYDDRGCFVESNSADNIRAIYQRHEAWIVDYHRSEIDKYFQ